MTPRETHSTGNQGRATIGVTGLATMGRNLARNLARNGYTVALHNRTQGRVDALVSEFGHEGDFVPSASIEEFVDSLERPRAIIIMVKAGGRPTQSSTSWFLCWRRATSSSTRATHTSPIPLDGKRHSASAG